MHRTRQLVFHALVATGVFARIPVNTTSSSTTSDDPAGPYTETQSIIEAPAMPATTTVTGIPSLTYSHTTLTSPGPGLVAPTPSKLPRTCKKVQKDFAPGEGMNQTRADAIRDAYVHGWNAYVKYAWGYDSLQPLTLDGTNDYYGWGVTVFDALDTAIVMNLTSIVFQQLDWIAGVDFTWVILPARKQKLMFAGRLLTAQLADSTSTFAISEGEHILLWLILVTISDVLLACSRPTTC